MTRTAACATVLVVVVAGCNDGSGSARDSAPRGSTAEAAESKVAGATKADCEVGVHPDYYVPAESRPRVVGCAELKVSAKPVEFSANSELTFRRDHVCMNPAYRGRGMLGIYIPTACTRDPVGPRLDVLAARVPRQGTPRYQLVIWGTTNPGTARVTATFADGKSASAILDIDSDLAEALHVRRRFSLFVTELPRRAGCSEVVLDAQGRHGHDMERLKPGDLHIPGGGAAPQSRICGA